MSQLTELLSSEQVEDAIEESTERPVFIFKQSTTCPISAGAFQQFNTFLNANADEDFGAYFVKVRETREISDQIAEETGIEHESPQALLVKDGEVLWNESHAAITAEVLQTALETYQ